MSTQDNKAIIRRLIEEVFNKGNMAAADEWVAPSFATLTPFPGQGSGPQGYTYAARIVRGAFPDFQWTVEDMIAEGDKVMVRGRGEGTHFGEWPGIPATGKRISVNTIDIYRLADGKVVEHWNLGDTFSMLQQLGVIPSPDQSSA